MKKQIALVLAATLILGSAPAWTEAAGPGGSAARNDRAVRDSIDAAVARALERNTPSVGTTTPATVRALTAEERNELAARSGALATDPVARGGGQVVLLLLGTALSIGGTIYLVHEMNKNKSTTQFAPAGARLQ